MEFLVVCCAPLGPSVSSQVQNHLIHPHCCHFCQLCVVIHNRAETSSVVRVRYHSSYLTHTYTWRHTHKHRFHGNRIQGLLWLVVCPGQLKMVSAAMQRLEINVWILNNRTGANIDYYTASCVLLPEAEFLLKLTKNHIHQVNSSLWDIPPVVILFGLCLYT